MRDETGGLLKDGGCDAVVDAETNGEGTFSGEELCICLGYVGVYEFCGGNVPGRGKTRRDTRQEAKTKAE